MIAGQIYATYFLGHSFSIMHKTKSYNEGISCAVVIDAEEAYAKRNIV